MTLETGTTSTSQADAIAQDYLTRFGKIVDELAEIRARSPEAADRIIETAPIVVWDAAIGQSLPLSELCRDEHGKIVIIGDD